MTLGDAERDRALRAEPIHTMATVGSVLLEPTRIYARTVLSLRSALRAAGGDVRGIAHITGGGLPGNVPRALPAGLAARIDPTSWSMPSVMRLFGALGGIDDLEIRATFNGGIGMIVIVAPGLVDLALGSIPGALVIGTVVAAGPGGGRYVEAAEGAT